MAWLGKVSLGGFQDLAGAVTKLSESVKNIEKNFDTALGLEENPGGGSEDSGTWPSTSDGNALFDPEMNIMGQDKASDEVERSGKVGLREDTSLTVREAPSTASGAVTTVLPKKNEASDRNVEDSISHDSETTLSVKAAERHEDKLHDEDVSIAVNAESIDGNTSSQQNEEPDSKLAHESSSKESTTRNSDVTKQMETDLTPLAVEVHHVSDSQQSQEKQEIDVENVVDNGTSEHKLTSNTPESTSGDVPNDQSSHDFSEHQLPDSPRPDEASARLSESNQLPDSPRPDDASARLSESNQLPDSPRPDEASARLSESNTKNHEVDSDVRSAEVNHKTNPTESDSKVQSIDSRTYTPNTIDPCMELEKVKKEMKMMEAALQGAAKQAQVKADEIAKLMNENELLKSAIVDLKKKSVEAENDALREEYHQRVSFLERKVYALTRERDTLRREQNKKNDVTALLKEKDEIISQVMAEGETLSKKQATQEATIRKLRAQIREFEEEKQRLNSKLQVEETKVESIKRDKAATEKLLQETIERNQAELATQKEFYSNALSVAKEAETLAETRANNEAKVELENRLREAAEREAMLVQTLEELRQTLSRTERQAAFREDMLQRDIDDVQKRYQASDLRYNELIAQVPESTRPLLRQIEAMQEAAARKAEAWAGVEANLNSRLEAAEAKAAASEEKERLMNNRLSQTLSRMTVLETQIACLRTEQTQLSRSLDKERQRASENRQEYLAAMEEVATHEGRAKQLEEELRELRTKHRKELQEVLVQKELLEKDLEREKSTRLEPEGSHLESSVDQDPILKHTRAYEENGKVPVRNLLSAGSLGSMEESYFLQTSLDSSEGSFADRRNSGEMSHYYLKSMTPSAFESALRQKDGELASYISRLASLESLRDSLAEELVKMTAQCEKLQAEASLIPSIRAELDALRRRHSSALELMGERDEELEELRADIVDMKEMYREQVDLLVNKIQMITSADAV